MNLIVNYCPITDCGLSVLVRLTALLRPYKNIFIKDLSDRIEVMNVYYKITEKGLTTEKLLRICISSIFLIVYVFILIDCEHFILHTNYL